MEDAEEDGEAKIDVSEMLQLQLSEYEMLQSMFPGVNELKIDDVNALIQIKSFVEGNSRYEYLHSRLGFTVKIAVEDYKVRCSQKLHFS